MWTYVNLLQECPTELGTLFVAEVKMGDSKQHAMGTGHTKCPSEIWVCNPPVTAVELFAAHYLKCCHCHRDIVVLPVHRFAQSFYFFFSWDGEALDVPELRFTTLFPKIQDLLRNICSCLCFPTSSRENCFIPRTSSSERRKKEELSSLSSSLFTVWKKLTGMASFWCLPCAKTANPSILWAAA